MIEWKDVEISYDFSKVKETGRVEVSLYIKKNFPLYSIPIFVSFKPEQNKEEVV